MSPECGTCVWQGLGPVAGRGTWDPNSTAHCLLREGRCNGRDDSELLQAAQGNSAQWHRCILAHGEWDSYYSICFYGEWQHKCIPQVQLGSSGSQVLRNPQVVVQTLHKEPLAVLAYWIVVVEALAA